MPVFSLRDTIDSEQERMVSTTLLKLVVDSLERATVDSRRLQQVNGQEVRKLSMKYN